MYEACFGLNRRPFASVPRVEEYYPATAMEGARQTLARCIERAEGVGIVVGPSGTGKTLLCELLAQQFRDGFEVAVLSCGRLSTRRALFQAILYELGQPYRGMDEGDLRLAMVDHLTAGEDCPQGMVLLVDEAHTLPLRLLEEIRMITNLVCNGQPRTRLVLVGGPVFEERLASPKLESFSQRIVARCYLESFNRAETQEYIHSQLDKAGGRGERVFPKEACQAVYRATDGVPRLINQLCDHALLLAYTRGRRQVGSAGVEEAWADLQQLPTPWNGDDQNADKAGNVIEFGGLDDESEDAEQAGDAPEATVPALRVAPESDEPISDPIERLEQIEGALAGLDEDFQPAGSIGPELELFFGDPENPFNEPFEEEEIVVDRHGPTPQDEQPERSQDVAEPAGAPLPGTEDFQFEAADEDACGLELPEAESTGVDEASSVDVADAVAPVAAVTAGQDDEDEWETEPSTVLLHRQQPVEADEEARPVAAEDEDMIVVEDGCEEAEPPHTRRVVAVRRREYGQLFAKLRRSC